MERNDDTNREIQDNSGKERFNNFKKQIEKQAARLFEKMDRKIKLLMKVPEEMTSEHKYLEKRKAQGSSKSIRTSIECQKDINVQLASRHQHCTKNEVFN